MSKKKKKLPESTIENYYDLKIDKVDELVAALKGETAETAPEISMNISDCTGLDDPKNKTIGGRQKRFDPYKRDFLNRIPHWIKALFIKWWFAGVVCYFVMMGIMISDTLDSMVLTGAVLGLITDILVNPLFRFMETDAREYNNFMMFPFPFKAFWTFFTNLIYYVLVMICVMYCYAGLNELINLMTHQAAHTLSVGVEPLLFGVFCVIVDMAFIGIKDLIVYLVKRARKNKETVNV